MIEYPNMFEENIYSSKQAFISLELAMTLSLSLTNYLPKDMSKRRDLVVARKRYEVQTSRKSPLRARPWHALN